MIKAPKNETLWEQLINSNDEVTYIITSDLFRSTYKLYIVEDGKPVYTKHKANNPRDLDKWIEVN